MEITKITEALQSEDFCESMSFLGFKLVLYDEYSPDDYYFENYDLGLIIYYSPNSKKYTIFSKTREVETA